MIAEGMTIEAPYLLAIFAGAGGVIALLFRLLISSKDKELTSVIASMNARLEEVEGLKKVYQEVAAEAVRSAAETTNFYRQKEGKPPIILPASVVPEGKSPPSVKQLEAAQAASFRAAMAAIKLATGQAPRKEPGHPHELETTSAQAAQQAEADEKVVVEKIDKLVQASVDKQAEMSLKKDIAAVPEKTAKKVVEKLKAKEEE